MTLYWSHCITSLGSQQRSLSLRPPLSSKLAEMSLQQRRDEIAAKRAKLEELKRTRQQRDKERLDREGNASSQQVSLAFLLTSYSLTAGPLDSVHRDSDAEQRRQVEAQRAARLPNTRVWSSLTIRIPSRSWKTAKVSNKFRSRCGCFRHKPGNTITTTESSNCIHCNPDVL